LILNLVVELNWLHQKPIEIVRDWRHFPARLRQGSLSIGNFDGVHKGHQVIVRKLVAAAKSNGHPSIVFTFDPHPLSILRPESAPVPLTTLSQRANLLAKFGVDVMVVCPADRSLLGLDYVQFFRQVILEQLSPHLMVEGPNFYFGKQRGGNIQSLSQLCERHNIGLDIVQPQEIDGQMISSSEIRRFLKSGDIENANHAFGHHFGLAGEVIAGDQRGRTLGFPTANIGNIGTLVPKDGVYAGWTQIAGHKYATAINIGAPLTFGQNDSRVEAHIIGLDQTLYGDQVLINLQQRLRDTQRFQTQELLQEQIRNDIAATIRCSAGVLKST